MAGDKAVAAGTATFAVPGFTNPDSATAEGLDLSALTFTLDGCPLTQDDLGTGAGKIQWQWKVNATGTGTAAAETTGTIALNSNIIPLTGTWAANDKLVLTLNLTYNGITITKTAAVTVTFTI